MRQHNQQGTPWSQNWVEFKSAVKGEPRADGRNRLMAILHEGLNTFLVEPVRKYPKMSGFILLFLLIALLDCRVAFAESKLLTWTAPTEREDGTPLSLSEIHSYTAYVSEGNNSHAITDISSIDTSLMITLYPGDNTINMTTVDTEGRESARSNDVFLAGLDTDLDGIRDVLDNCTLVANAAQRDTDLDGYGNMCDADLDGDNVVGFSDYSMFGTAWGTSDPDSDFDGDGTVGFSDYGIFGTSWGGPPGPAGELVQ